MNKQNYKELELHEYCKIFPAAQDREFSELKKSILENGQTDTIKLLKGKIIDGKNRYKACLALGIEPKTEEIQIEDPLKYCLSQNLHRRHISESQRSLIAAQICTSLKLTQDNAAEYMSVSRRSVCSAVIILSEGVESLIQAVSSGKISVHAASKIAKLDKEEQEALLSEGKKSISTFVKTGKRSNTEKPRKISLSLSAEEMSHIDKIMAKTSCKSIEEALRLAIEKLMEELSKTADLSDYAPSKERNFNDIEV